MGLLDAFEADLRTPFGVVPSVGGSPNIGDIVWASKPPGSNWALLPQIASGYPTSNQISMFDPSLLNRFSSNVTTIPTLTVTAAAPIGYGGNGASIYDLDYGNGVYVAVGNYIFSGNSASSATAVYYSTDFQSWNCRDVG